MTKTESKNIVRVANCFAALLLVKIIEDFLLVPRTSLNFHSMFSTIIGIILLLIYMRVYAKTFEDIGLVFSRRKVKKGVLVALLLNIVPVLVIYPVQYFYLRSKGSDVIFTAYYESADHSFSSGAKSFLVYIAVGFAVAVLHSVFFELFFRGLIMRLASRTFRFATVNVIQALFYTLWYLISVLRVFANSDGLNTYSLVVLFLFVVSYEFIIAVKMGLLKRASGSLWLCIFDHVMFAFIPEVIHVQAYSSSGSLLPENSYISLLAYGFISLFIAYIYYNKRLKKLDDAKVASSEAK